MAGRRGYAGRSREDLFAAAQSVTEMLAQLKGMDGQGGTRSMETSQDARWRPAGNLYSHQEWEEPPMNPEGPWRRGGRRGRPGPDRPPRNYYPPEPLAQEMGHPQDRPLGPRGRRQNRGGHRQQPQSGPGDPAMVRQLVEVLAQSPNFSISLLNLLEHHNMPSQQVRAIVSHRRHLFHLQEEVVSLAPRLKLCSAYSSPSGCQNLDVCDRLHMCPKYVLGWCSDGNDCVLGHRWHTDHNLAILKRLSMEYVRYRVLHELLRGGRCQGQKDGRGEAGPLEVCKAYNKAGCDQLNCPNLHVCLSFVVGLTTCTRDSCQLSHDLLSPACCQLLKRHNLPVNEAPRDVAMALLQANPGLKDQARDRTSAKPRPGKAATQGQGQKGGKDKDTTDLVRQRRGKKDQASTKKESKENSSSASETETESDDSYGKEKKGRKGKGSHVSKVKAGKQERHSRVRNCSDSSATETDSEDDTDDRPVKGKRRDKTGKPLPKQQPKDNSSQEPRKELPKPPPKPAPRRTLWTHYFCGDVPDPQICYYSVETMCRDEANGCQKLHSPTHFHWQVKEQHGRWINLPLDQVTCIEKAFCDPALDGVDLPRLDPSKLDPSVSGLILLLGRDVWHADFRTSSLTNSTKSKKLDLRRLCTEPVVNLPPFKVSTFHWYFLDINKKWVKYGDVDTAGNQHLVSSVTSADIERHYQNSPQQPFTFKNSKFTFVLDVTSMTQTNQSTKMSREVRRRPEPHLPNKEEKDGKDKSGSDLPQHWDAMQPEQRSHLVTLGPTSDEYKQVVSLLGTAVPAANVVKVERIQNPFMWRALQNKIKDMTILYKDVSKVNVQQLFHGTSHNVVPSICSENFDWRLHGTASGQSYGRGTYFGTNAGTSYGYCRAGTNGLKYMFVARVAVGTMAAGDSSMARPPINPTTSMPYDSTVDNPARPNMVIKYTMQEYYPEYLLTLK